jgi:hypothetical protein
MLDDYGYVTIRHVRLSELLAALLSLENNRNFGDNRTLNNKIRTSARKYIFF